jgi:malic enzyme
MLAAAASALAELSDATKPGAALLPPVTCISVAVAAAVVLAARAAGLADAPIDNPTQQAREEMWTPAYPKIELV